MKKIVLALFFSLLCFACAAGFAEQSRLTATVPAEHTYSVQIGEHGVAQIAGKRYTEEINITVPRFDALTIEIAPEWGYLLSDVHASSSAHVTLENGKIIIDSAVLDTSFALSFSEVTTPMMRLGAPEIALAPGMSVIMPAFFAPSSVNSVATQVNWTSDHPETAAIDANGRITAKKDGTALITGTCGTLSAACNVTVRAMNTVTFPRQLAEIHENAMTGNTSVEMAVFPSAKEISDHVFDGCKNLKIVSLPSAVETIGDDAFSGCPSVVLL